MENQDKISIGEWWSYTCEMIRRACSEIGKAEVLWSIVAAILTGGFSLHKGWSHFHDVITTIIATSVGFAGVFLIQLVIKLLVTPAKMAKEQAAKIEEEKRRHLETKENLENQTQLLRAQLDDRRKRKQIKDALGDLRMVIQSLCARLSEIPYFKYYNETRHKIEHDYLDVDNAAYRLLRNKVGKSEAVSYGDDEKIPKVANVPSDFDMEAFRERWIAQRFMFNRLKYKSEQLEKAEAKLDSEDFILPIDDSQTSTPPVVQT
jgi:hypothetical protein